MESTFEEISPYKYFYDLFVSALTDPEGSEAKSEVIRLFNRNKLGNPNGREKAYVNAQKFVMKKYLDEEKGDELIALMSSLMGEDLKDNCHFWQTEMKLYYEVLHSCKNESSVLQDPDWKCKIFNQITTLFHQHFCIHEKCQEWFLKIRRVPYVFTYTKSERQCSSDN